MNKKKTQQQVCKVEDTSYMLREGWRVINSYTQTRVETIRIKGSDQDNYYNRSAENRVVPEYQGFLVTDTWLILEKDTDEILAEFKKELTASRTAQNEADARACLAEEAKVAAVAAESRTNRNLEKTQEDLAALGTRFDNEREAKRELELDIGKLREHFGRKACDEALATNA